MAHSTPAGQDALRAPVPRDHSSARRYDLTGILFVSPYVILLLLFGIGPAVFSVVISFVSRSEGVGFGNYAKILGDFRLWPAVANVGLYLLVWLPIMVVGVLFFALLLHHRPSRVGGALRLLYFLPGAVTGSASVLLWYFMLEPTMSPFGPILRGMGLETANDVFQNGNLVIIFATIAFTTGVGQWIIIMYGAMQSIPDDVIEAAAIDGSGPIRTALQVKLPLVSKYVIYMVVLSLANGVQLFVEPQLIYAVTRSVGSPWWSLNQFGYSLAFQNADFGSAAVVSLVLLVLCTVAGLFMVFKTDFFTTEGDR